MDFAFVRAHSACHLIGAQKILMDPFVLNLLVPILIGIRFPTLAGLFFSCSSISDFRSSGMESKLLSLGKIGYFSVNPDKLLLKQEIEMSPVSLGFCRREVSKEEREREPVYKISSLG